MTFPAFCLHFEEIKRGLLYRLAVCVSVCTFPSNSRTSRAWQAACPFLQPLALPHLFSRFLLRIRFLIHPFNNIPFQ
jgi:hypothetical protein